jgi:hypothetical protein
VILLLFIQFVISTKAEMANWVENETERPVSRGIKTPKFLEEKSLKKITYLIRKIIFYKSFLVTLA